MGSTQAAAGAEGDWMLQTLRAGSNAAFAGTRISRGAYGPLARKLRGTPRLGR